MAATSFSGIDALITFATGYSEKCTGWTIDATAEDVDTSALGDNWSVHQGGIKDWSGTYTCQLTDSFDSITGGSTGGAALGAAAASATFTGGSNSGFTGTIVVTGINAAATVRSGPNTITMNFVGSGVLSAI